MLLRYLAIVCVLLAACQDSSSGEEKLFDAKDTSSSDAVSGDGSGSDAAGDAEPGPGDDATGSATDGTGDPGGGDAVAGDTSAVDSGPLADAAGAPEGTPCDSDDACASGWCVPSAIGQVCVDVCVDVCDAGQECIPASTSGTDPVFLCVPFVAPPGDDTVGGDAAGDASSSDVPVDDATVTDATGVDGAVDGGPVDDSVTTDVVPDVPGEETVVTDPDSDGDGIPDSVDNLPCLAIYLVVYNQDVTSASLTLNGVEVVGANQFPTLDAITVYLNPVTGENTLALGGKLTGSPSDTLTLIVVDSEGTIYFATVITREPGRPTDHSYTFNVDVTCP